VLISPKYQNVSSPFSFTSRRLSQAQALSEVAWAEPMYLTDGI